MTRSREEDQADGAAAAERGPWRAAGETLLLALVVPLLGRVFNRADPFFVLGPVSWPLFAPLLAGLRHGFLAGFGCAAGLSFALVGLWRHPLLPVPAFPGGLIVGLLLSGMVAGEFAHLWRKRASRLGARHGYERQRFDEFARNYQLLKVSHDALEERSAAAAGNLRTALGTLRFELLRLPPGDLPLRACGPLVLEIFQAFGQVQGAALLPIENGRILPPAAVLGEIPDGVALDPLVDEALRSGWVASWPESGDGEVAAERKGALLAAVPLVDVEGQVRAVLAVSDMPFFAFTVETLRLLALMGGAVADSLAFGGGSLGDEEALARFRRQARRCAGDARAHGIPAHLLRFAVAVAGRGNDVVPRVLEQRRGLDEICLATDADGRACLLVLLPLTDGAGVDGYLKRVQVALQHTLGFSLEDGGVKLASAAALGTTEGDAALRELGRLSSADRRRARA